MAITVVGVGTQLVSVTVSATLAPSYPAGYTAVADDYCIIIIAGRHDNGSTLVPATPSGYTLIGSQWIDRNGVTIDGDVIAYFKKLTTSESAPTIAAPAGYGISGISAQLAIARGADTTTFLDATTVTSTSTLVSTWVPTGITTATAGAMVLSIVATVDDNALGLLSGSDQGFTLEMGGANYDTQSGLDHAVGFASKVIASEGAVTCPTWEQTVGPSDEWGGITIAIKPAGAPPAATELPPLTMAPMRPGGWGRW